MQLIEIFQVRLDEHKIHLMDALKPYHNDPSIYITFSNIEKVGINPQSEYDTPLGIYTYPLDAMWDMLMFDNVPFGSERSFVHVLKAHGNVLDLRKYNYADWVHDLEKLREIFMNGKFAQRRDAQVKDKIMQNWREREEAFEENGGEKRVDEFIAKQKDQLWDLKIKEAQKTAFVRTPGGWIWNATRLLAVFFHDDTTVAPNSTFSSGTTSKPPVIWNAIFRQLGYDGAADRHGEGIIHTNEPTQAVFFSKAPLRHLETVANNRERPHDVESKIAFTDYMHFYNWLDDYSTHDYDDKNTIKDMQRQMSLLKIQWSQLMNTGESQNFSLGISKKEFDEEMVELPRAFIRKMLDASAELIPIVVSTIMQHPEMQTKEAWRAFIAHFNTTKPKLLKVLLSPAIISLHAKINDISYEESWLALSEKVIHHLTYNQQMIDLVMKDKWRGAAMIKAKSLIRPLERWLAPQTYTDEALESEFQRKRAALRRAFLDGNLRSVRHHHRSLISISGSPF